MNIHSKSIAIILILIISVSSLLMTKPVSASTVPAIPEYTLKYSEHHSNTPATYSTNPYTGENITYPGNNYQWHTIDVTIKNQPFTSYTFKDENNATWAVTLYYNVRTKGHFSSIWTEFTPDYYIAQNSTRQYTVITFFVGAEGPNGDIMTGENVLAAISPDGGMVDFQVEALIGYVHPNLDAPAFSLAGGFTPPVFNGAESNWSETQTVTIPNTSVSISTSTNTVPTLTSPPTVTAKATLLVPKILLIISVVIAFAMSMLAVLLYKKNKLKKG